MNHLQVQLALQAIAEQHQGRLMPEAVVEAAKDPKSLLHGMFTWDDAEAAHAHRVEQARTLIRTVRVVMTVDRQQITVPGYVRDPLLGPREAGYVATATLRRDPEAARAAVLTEVQRATAALKRARELAAVLEVGPAISQVIEQLGILHVSIDSPAQASA